MSKSVLLSGTEAAAELRNSLKLKVLDIQKNDPTFLPKLVIVQVSYARSECDDKCDIRLILRSEAERTAMSTSG